MLSAVSARRRTFAVLVALALLLLTALAATASAAPQEPTLGLDRLQELLQGSPAGVPGYFKTVLKGDAITEIPCAVIGVVPGARGDGGALIMLQASGPDIDAIGGIAHGMSGSPVYVQDGGEWRLIGAVSYGDVFTSGGLGLATPVEDMMTMETDYPALGVTVRLAAPLRTSDGPVTGVRFAEAPKPTRTATPTRTFRPLATLSVTGLPKDSYVYRELEKRMSEAGVTLVGGLAGGSGAADAFETPLVPGAAVGALATRGSVSYGGIGTVTYTTADGQVAAFGHPFGPLFFYDPMGDGASAYYLTNADVVGVWGSSYDPYKVAVPGAVRGTVYLDSPVGILGAIGAPPAEAVFMSSASTNGGPVKTSAVSVPQAVADEPLNAYLMSTLTYPGIYQSCGDGAFSGNLAYDLDIVVSDGTADYTIHRESMWDSTVDAPFMADCEQELYLGKLLADPYGIAPCTIKSVTMQSTLTTAHNKAAVSGLSVPGGLHVGNNTVHVTLYPYGSQVPSEKDVTLTVPKGMRLSGQVYAAAPDTGVVDEGDGWFGISDPIDGDSWGQPAPRRTLGELADAINAVPAGDEIQVAFDPGGFDEWYSDLRPWSSEATVTTADADTFLTGIASRRTSRLRLRAPGGAAPFRAPAFLHGMIWPADGDTTVHITAKVAGSESRFVADVPTTTESSDSYYGADLSFEHVVTGLRHTTVFTATWDGDDLAIGATGTCKVPVRAAVTLERRASSGGRVGLTAVVRPADCGGAVAFERKTASGWVRIGKVTLGKTGRALMAWRPQAGATPVRAHFLGSRLNAAAVSPALMVR